MAKSNNNWELQPLAPPPPPEEYFKVARAALQGKSSGPMAAAYMQPGAPPLVKPLEDDPYAAYLRDHARYVTQHMELSSRLHSIALVKKAIKKEFSEEVALSPQLNLSSHGTHPRRDDVIKAAGVEPKTSTYPSVNTLALRLKPRVKQTPPAAKAAIVAAKTELRQAKVTAKATKLTTRADRVVATAEVASMKSKAKLSYAKVLAQERQDTSALTAKTAAETRVASSFRKKEKVESSRVPLYVKNGGSAKMPAVPAGTFLETSS
jgi:hypothetical protein